jgi:hypothetical protein
VNDLVQIVPADSQLIRVFPARTEWTPKALDLFSGAGGASMGLYMAGFDVTGVDIENQPHYPPFLKFVRGDATTFPLEGFDFIWSSPICQKHTQLNYLHRSRKYEDFIPVMRKRLIASGIPWVIENVPNAPLARGALVLCGTMFGLGTKEAMGIGWMTGAELSQAIPPAYAEFIARYFLANHVMP